MSIRKKLLMALVITVILVSGMGFSAQPAQAAGCAYYHVVRAGESLSWIARWYGAYWPYLAQINNIPAPRYRIYPGQTLCIAFNGRYYGNNNGYYYGVNYNYGTGGRSSYYGTNWSFSVASVQQNTSVTISAYNFPDNVLFKVKMGTSASGSWVDLPDFDTGNGGNYNQVINIPASLSGSNQLVVRLIQQKKNGKIFQYDQWFSNVPGGSGIGGRNVNYNPYYYNYYYGYRTIPTIWISNVARNSSVTIQTANFPPNLDFQVLMGPMGTRGHGYYVTTFNSGAGGSMTLTFPIPPQLYGAYQVSIRTQNLYTGYYSYNWFYNNTTY